MNNIKIYLAETGAIALLKKDFPLYQGNFNGKLLNVYVPTSILGDTLDTQYIDETGFVHTEAGTFTALKIGMTYLRTDGRLAVSNGFYMRYLKTLLYNGVEYALYERALPQAFTVYAGSGSSAPTLIVNVVNMQNNNELIDGEIILNDPTILEIITSQTCKLEVLPSTAFDKDDVIEASEWEIVNGEINDLYEKYDTVVNNVQLTIENYTYDKATIDQKDADALQSAKDYADENFYNETDADNRFVHLSGNETIADTKTFSASPNVPDATANLHAVNRQKMYSYAYSKAEVNNIMTPMQVDTYEHFLEWIAGTYTDVQPAGAVPADFIIGKKVLIAEAETPNFKCISLPVLSIDNFEELAEDIKYLSEINAVPFDDITSENGQGQVEQINEKVNQSARISEIETIDIEVGDWETSEFGVYYDYFSELLTDHTKQKFGWAFNLSEEEAQTLENENVYYKTDENLYVGGIYGTRIYLNKAPSISLNATMCIISYVNANITPSELTADKVGFANIVSGLTATRVQGAIDELKGITDDLESDKVDKSAIKQIIGTSETDLMSQNAITSELNSKVNQSDFNALKSKVIYEDSSITFAKQMLDKANLYWYVSGVKSNVLTLLSNSNYNIFFSLDFSYTGIDAGATKTSGSSINTIVNCHFGMNLTGGFNKIIELNDSGPGGLLRKTLLQVNGEFSTGSSTKDFQISSMYIRIIDSMGNGAVSDLDTLNFVLTDITGIRIVEMPYENIGE